HGHAHRRRTRRVLRKIAAEGSPRNPPGRARRVHGPRRFQRRPRATPQPSPHLRHPRRASSTAGGHHPCRPPPEPNLRPRSHRQAPHPRRRDRALGHAHERSGAPAECLLQTLRRRHRSRLPFLDLRPHPAVSRNRAGRVHAPAPDVWLRLARLPRCRLLRPMGADHRALRRPAFLERTRRALPSQRRSRLQPLSKGPPLTVPVHSAAARSTSNEPQTPPRLIPAGQTVTFIVVTALFFLWAIPNNLNDILIRDRK